MKKNFTRTMSRLEPSLRSVTPERSSAEVTLQPERTVAPSSVACEPSETSWAPEAWAPPCEEDWLSISLFTSLPNQPKKPHTPRQQMMTTTPMIPRIHQRVLLSFFGGGP